MITIDKLTKKYNKRSVLQNVSLRFQSGESIALIGPNGSGKTTLIKSILGLVMPDAGSLHFQNENIRKNFLYRKHIGYMPQSIHFPGNTTVNQLFSMIRDVRDYSEEPDLELYNLYELKNSGNKLLKNLSGGTKQKVNAAIAFLFQPLCYILDEPTAGLDPVSAEVLKQKIQKEISKGKLVIITSHIMADIEELTSRVVYMLDGNVFFDETVQNLLQQTNSAKLGIAITKLVHTKQNM